MRRSGNRVALAPRATAHTTKPWHEIMPVEVRGGRDFKVLKVNHSRVVSTHPPLLKVLKVNGMGTELA
jgi:hypothetical protein